MFFKSLLSILFGFYNMFFRLLVLTEGYLSSSLRAGKRPEVDRVLLELVRVLAKTKGAGFMARALVCDRPSNSIVHGEGGYYGR